MKKQSKINLTLNKKVVKTLDSFQSSKIVGGAELDIISSGSMMCLPEPDSSVRECPTASNRNLCATQIKPPCS